jgi:cell division protein FtsI (penicillin-binding protein 3)
VVQRGTGVAGQIEGLEVGGKTGTAHIATSAGYSKLFHSSFYGFANDELGHKYTIGVLVIKARKPYKYFAAQSAVPTFKKIANAMIELDYLKPKIAPKETLQEREAEISEPHKISAPSDTPKPTTKPHRPKPKLTTASFKPKPPDTISKPAQTKTAKKKQPELFNDLDMF